MRLSTLIVSAVVAVTLGQSAAAQSPSGADLRDQVANTERAFAKTMAARDHKAFKSFVSSEAVFFSSDKVLRGADQVAEGWKPYFNAPEPPFSWEPEKVEVLASGTLALSTGPVRDPTGRLIGTFTSIWRLEAPGTWRIVFDKGNAAPAPASR